MSNCTKCHEIGEAVINSKCLDCHEEIKNLQFLNKGYHSSKVVKEAECFDCHSEHHGRTFKIIHFDKDKFDHDLTGYKLKGKHKKVNCENCHKEKFRENKKLKKKSFLGLNHNCNTCHEDVHNKTLGNDCKSCHTEESFKPAVKFDHNNADFKLVGSHKKIECVRCHKIESADNKRVQRFKNVKHTNCSDCHTDIHKGKFGNNCSDCHSTKSFSSLTSNNKFDHSKTKYPLLGLHKKVKCNSCHVGGIKKKINYTRCSNCHKDFHRGEFRKGNGIPDCEICHSLDGFRPSSFTIEDHSKSRFILSGAHLAIPCEACHKSKKWTFKFSNIDCASCHENIHKDIMDEKYLNNENCFACHSTDKWKVEKFDHNRTSFPLIGKHKNISCSDCHFKNTFSGKRIQLFKNMEKRCEVCHTDIHQNQFAKNNKTDCNKCHTPETWMPSSFNHDIAGFKLEGIHLKLDCIKCHFIDDKINSKIIIYKNGKTKCSDCHSS